MRLLVAGVCTLLAVAILAGSNLGAAQDKKAKYTVKEVMRTAHKKPVVEKDGVEVKEDSLLEKVAKGKGDKADVEKLHELYTAMAQGKPRIGDEGAWKKRTDEIVMAAKGVLDGEKVFRALQKATNCQSCHTEFKGK